MKPYDIFVQQAIKNKRKIAIRCQNESIAYAALKNKIELFAIQLFKQTIQNSIVAILLPPSIDFVIAVFACQKLGLTCLPLDVSNPISFQKVVLMDAKVQYLITSSQFKDLAHAIMPLDAQTIYVDEDDKDRTVTINPEDTTIVDNELSYIIYTSGSTGAPKGVPVKVKSLLNLLKATSPLYKINELDKIPLFHSVAFDVSVWEMYATLLNGAELIIPPDDIKKSPQDYWQFIVSMGITIVNVTPSYFYLLLTTNANVMETQPIPHALRLFLLAGEAFHAKRIAFWFELEIAKKVEIFNMYGITEGTIHSTYLKIEPEMTQFEHSFIGQPLSGVDIAVVNEQNQPITNERGELVLSGVSVTSGYLGQEDLNKDRFIRANLDDTLEKVWFKTGDRVELTEKGLIYLGRKDRVIKIRGYRVNLMEIEYALCRCEGVRDAVVCPIYLAVDQLRLVAFIYTVDESLCEQNIIEILKHTLPEYMCPSRVMILRTFPLTRNGKVDTQTLIENYKNNQSLLQEQSDSMTMLERVKCAWSQVLGCEEIDMNANFFDVGGDSLLLAKLQYFLQVTLASEIKMMDLLRYPTIAKFMQFFNET